MSGWGNWLIHNRKEVLPLPLNFLHENWTVYREHFGDLGICIDYGDEGIDPIAEVRFDDDESRLFENAALIANAPRMFRLLLHSLKFLDNSEIKNEIYDLLSSVINPVLDV